MSFSTGDHVYAKWIGSGLHYPAKIVRSSGDHYTVEFQDGTRDKLSGKDITTEKRLRSRSPSRKSRSRSRSRGRSKSPARSKPKAKSSPSPTRKSPSRSKPKTPTARTPTTTPTRQSARIAKQESEKEEKKENAVQQQRKETPKKRSSSKGRQSEMLNKIKGVILGPGLTFGAMVFIPLFFIAFNVSCGKAKCTIKEAPKVPTDVNKYFNVEVVGVFCAYVAVLVVLALLSVGNVITIVTKKGGKRPRRRVNTLFSTIVLLAAFGVMTYMKLPVSYLYNHFLQFLATSIVFGALLSVVMYILGRKAPPSERNEAGNTGNFIIDLFNGCEVNPRVGLFNFKYFIASHFFCNGMILVNLSMLSFDYQKTGEINIAATMVAAFQGLYILTLLFNETAMSISHRDLNDGFGYMFAVWACAAPFFYTFPVRFLIQHPQMWSYYSLAGLAFLNLVGYVMMFGSLLQKSQFRKNPHDPALAHLDRIPTPNGKGLLVGGWWSLCRKPNYLGDLLQCFAWTAFCGCEFAMPYILPMFVLLILIDRQRQDEAECRITHGAAWDRYCQRVKSRLVPKIY